jgi:hypothetical protein
MKGHAVRCTQKEEDCMSVSYSEFFAFFFVGKLTF